MSFSALLAALKWNLSRRAGLLPLQLIFFTPRLQPCIRRNTRGMLACVILLVTAPPLPVRAAIEIVPQVGFHGVFQLGRPFPLEIELSNTGRPADGTLEVRVWKGGATKGGVPYLVNYRRDLFLAGQARKTVQFTVDPDFISRPVTISFASAEARASRELDLRRYFSPAPVLLLMSETSSLPALTLAASSQNRLVALSPDQLAADSRALLGVSHLILYDQSLRELSRAQILALDSWLTAGGKMIIIGSLNYALYQEPALSRFLPVRVTGAKQIAFVPSAGKGERPAAIGGVWAQTSKLVSGKTLTESDGMPILVEASRGRGRIVYLALDVGRPPLSQWDGLPKYLQSLIAPNTGDDAAPRTEWNDAVFNQLIASPSFISTYVPSGSLLFAMASYLGGIGVVTWLWQRRRLAPIRLLMTLTGIVFISAAAGYAHFSLGGNVPDGVLLSSTVLESSGDGFVDAQANLALFSTQPRQYDLRMDRGWIDLTPVSIRPRESVEQAVVLQDGGGASRYQLPLREWDFRLFRMRRIDRFPLNTQFETQGDRLIMKVENRSAKDLANCWLLLPGQRFDLGAIPRGTSWRKSFPLTSAKTKDDANIGRADAVSFREVTFPDKTRDVLFHSSMFPRDGDPRWAGSAAVFFGWVKNPEPHVQVDDPRIQGQDYALFRAIFPLAGDEDE
jgi:hypothetical protein